MRGGADHGRELGLDEGLVDGLGGLTDAVINLRDRECVQDLQQCRLVKGHRALCPFARTIGLVSLTIARWPPTT
jgi:ClpP class serine protease